MSIVIAPSCVVIQRNSLDEVFKGGAERFVDYCFTQQYSILTDGYLIVVTFDTKVVLGSFCDDLIAFGLKHTIEVEGTLICKDFSIVNLHNMKVLYLSPWLKIDGLTMRYESD